MTKNKTLTLDELFDKLKSDSQESVPYATWQKWLDNTFEEARQQFLQWVADEVVGKTVYGKDGSPINHTIANHRDKQRQILKAAGWKPSDKEEK